MPNVLSRFAAGTLGLRLLPAQCHEISHTWHPSCVGAVWDPYIPAWLFCLKTYGTLYTLKALLDQKGRADRVRWLRVALNTLRSSAFLTTTAVLFMAWLCIFRRLLGFATWPTISTLNAFAACAMTIWIEPMPRRGMLVPYLLNLASEALFRQAKHRGWWKRPSALRSRAQSALFGLSAAAMVALLDMNCSGSKSARAAASLAQFLRNSHGVEVEKQRQEDPGLTLRAKTQKTRSRENQIPDETSSNVDSTRHRRGSFGRVCGSREKDRDDGLRCRNRQTHKECARRAGKLALKNFSLSLGAVVALKFVRILWAATAKAKNASSSSSTITTTIGTVLSLLRLPAFLGTMPLLCQFSQCICASLFPNKNVLLSRSLSVGISSGLAMAFLWPNNTLALYVFWKMVELAFFRLADSGLVPVLPCADSLLFALASSYLLSLAILEPHALRPSYYKFLCSLTNNRLQQVNRPLIDRTFGTNACARLPPDYRQPIVAPKLRTLNPSLYQLGPDHF